MSDFVVGGTISAESAAYIERGFEDRCFRFLSEGNWVLLLGPRQHGKSSALVRLARRLDDAGIRTARVDFQSFSDSGDDYANVLAWLARRFAESFEVALREPPQEHRDD